MAFTLGVAAGIFGAAQQEERSQYAGLARKAEYAITKGVQFVQIDLESISEFQEADIDKKLKRIKDQLGIRFGLHSENVAFGSREFPHFDSAISQDYRRGHERLMIILKESGKIGFEYVLVHSSESVPFIFLNRELQPSDLVDPWGNPLDFFIKFVQDRQGIYYEKFDINQGWIWKQDELWLDILHDSPKGYLDRLKEDRILNLKEQVRRAVAERKIRQKKLEKLPQILSERGISQDEFARKNQFEQEKIIFEVPITKDEIEKPTVTEEEEIEQEAMAVFSQEEEKFNESQLRELWKLYLRLMRSRNLSYGPERIAYYFIAKWMEVNKDPLWESIIKVSIEYYAKKDKKEVEEWLRDKRIKKISIDDEVFRKNYSLWVPAVSAKYFMGHFTPEDNPLKKNPPKDFVYDKDNVIAAIEENDPKKILDKHKMYFILETPMAGAGMEDLLRLPQPAQMYYLIKEIGSQYLGIAVDIEHMLMDGLNVELAIEVIPQEAGKYVRVLHSGWPSPLGPAHIPIPLGSEQQFYLYKTYWNLKQKGMCKDPNDIVYLIFERGGGGDPIQQSILALRAIKEFLEKDVPPNKLPLEFWGLDTGQWASTDRQLATIREHAWDPLKGLLQVPEEEHGIYGRAAIEKGKAEEWRKEKFR